MTFEYIEKHIKKRNVFLKVKVNDWLDRVLRLSAIFKPCNGGINDESFDINQNVKDLYNLASEAFLKQLKSNNALGHVSGWHSYLNLIKHVGSKKKAHKEMIKVWA